MLEIAIQSQTLDRAPICLPIQKLQSHMQTRATVIIPTLCNSVRAEALLRAIHSVGEASSAPVGLLICINGRHVDESLADRVAKQPGVRCLRLIEGSLPMAISAGRRSIQTEYFAFLDDDDELLPGSIDRSLAVFSMDETVDVVASNGYRQTSVGQSVVLTDCKQLEVDLLSGLFVANWLASCGGLYRTASVAAEYFDTLPKLAEWTWLAFTLAMSGKHIRILDEPGYIIHDTPNSLSKDPKYGGGFIKLYERMLEMQPPPHICQIIRERISSTHHDLSVEMLERSRLREAIRMHLLSLRTLRGLRYLTFTRHLLIAAMRGKIVGTRLD